MVRVQAAQVLFATAVLIPLTPSPAFCQTGPVAVQLVHAAGAAPAFEVATIKPNDDPSARLLIQLSPAHFSVGHGTLHDLIKFAYGVKTDNQIVGEPAWAHADHFDVNAKASDEDVAAFEKLDLNGKMQTMRLMLQSLLTERFHLKVHFEPRDLPVYVLSVASGGIKMKPVQVDPFPPPGVHAPPGAHLPSIRPTGPHEITATAWPMTQMTEWLSFQYELSDRPVIDETGLQGNYDFVLSGIATAPPSPADAEANSQQESVTSLFAALPQQLGLKLDARKAPVEVLVIDHVEQPTQN